MTTTEFVEHAARRTLPTMTTLYASKAVRDAVLKSPMERGRRRRASTSSRSCCDEPRLARRDDFHDPRNDESKPRPRAGRLRRGSQHPAATVAAALAALKDAPGRTSRQPGAIRHHRARRRSACRWRTCRCWPSAWARPRARRRALGHRPVRGPACSPSFVDEPARVTPAQMDRWCRDFDNWGICDTVCFVLFDRTPHAWPKVEAVERQAQTSS